MPDTTRRRADLTQVLSDRRRAVEDDVQSRLRHGRADRSNDVSSPPDVSGRQERVM